jgi:hypothetical protein
MADKKILWGTLALLFGVIVTGCTSSPVINSFMDRSIPVREHALLLVDPNVGVSMIDGEMSFRASIVYENRTKIIFLIPGRHSLMVAWISRTSNTRTTSENTSMDRDFQAGCVYRLTGKLSGNSVFFQISEENNPSVWDSNEVARQSYPKKEKSIMRH